MFGAAPERDVSAEAYVGIPGRVNSRHRIQILSSGLFV